MFQKKEIDALVQRFGKYLLIVFYLFVIGFSILALFIFLALNYHNDLLVVVGVLLFIIPMIFFRVKINLFTKKVAVRFSEEFIEINGKGKFNYRFVYSDIKCFSVSNYSSDKAFTINFILRNGTKWKYIFFRQIDKDENVLNNVLFYFSSYNRGKMQKEKIQISPAFFLTKPGKLFVAVTAFAILSAVTIQIVFKPKIIPYSLLAVLAGYVQIKAIQMNNKVILRKFREMDE